MWPSPLSHTPNVLLLSAPPPASVPEQGPRCLPRAAQTHSGELHSGGAGGGCGSAAQVGGVAQLCRWGVWLSCASGGVAQLCGWGVWLSCAGGGCGSAVQVGVWLSCAGEGCGSAVQVGVWLSCVGGGVAQLCGWGVWLNCTVVSSAVDSRHTRWSRFHPPSGMGMKPRLSAYWVGSQTCGACSCRQARCQLVAPGIPWCLATLSLAIYIPVYWCHVLCSSGQEFLALECRGFGISHAVCLLLGCCVACLNWYLTHTHSVSPQPCCHAVPTQPRMVFLGARPLNRLLHLPSTLPCSQTLGLWAGTSEPLSTLPHLLSLPSSPSLPSLPSPFPSSPTLPQD